MSRLDELARAASGAALPPVDRWNPPPCGDIGLKIGTGGTWFYQGSPIGRMPLVKLFARVLRRDADGSYWVVTPVEKVPVEVADAPFEAVEMEVGGAGSGQRLVFRTNVDDIVACDAEHPMRFSTDPVGGGLKPYVRVRGRLDALVVRALYYDLVELAVSEQRDEGEVLGLWSGGCFFPLRDQGAGG